MNYIIHTPSAMRLKKEIFDSVTAGVDANKKDIITWQCTENDSNEHVLVYSSGQWVDKGCIVLNHNRSHNELQVRFYYWDSWKDRNDDDDKVMFGRFTELILVHFSYFIDKITIE